MDKNILSKIECLDSLRLDSLVEYLDELYEEQLEEQEDNELIEDKPWLKDPLFAELCDWIKSDTMTPTVMVEVTAVVRPYEKSDFYLAGFNGPKFEDVENSVNLIEDLKDFFKERAEKIDDLLNQIAEKYDGNRDKIEIDADMEVS